MTATRRTRTPSEVKWLANELAVLAGQMQQIDDQVALLRAKRARLEAAHASLARVAQLMDLPALPNQVPAVRPHLPLGKRGALRNAIRNELRAAYPRCLDTVFLTEAVIQMFALRFATRVEYQRFRHRQVLKTLQKLADNGEVEGLHERRTGVNVVGVWRLKVHEPSIVDLLAMEPDASGD